jgi:acetyl esterase/lipase/esterase/lipase superfamily enzyme
MREKPARAPAGATVVRDLEYGWAPGGITLKLDLYRPDPPGPTPRPLVVWIHGGGWTSGSKANPRAARLVARGYVVASIRYRLSHEAVFPAQIHDCKAAIRWLRANAGKYGIDPERIGAWGSSAGGHLVALLGTSGSVASLEGTTNTVRASSRVRAVVDFCGPADLSALRRPVDRETAKGAVVRLLGGTPEEKPELAALASPVSHVTEDDAPFLIVHGRDDRTVPPEQSEKLHETLVGAGVDSTLKLLDGVGHGIRGKEADRAVDAFLDRHLGPLPPVTGRRPENTNARPDWTRHEFRSDLLEREVRYHLYRPPGYEAGTRRYPTIYWLHGLGGSSRRALVFASRVDGFIRDGKMPPVLVVGVDGGRASFYCDAERGEAIESMILEELIPLVDRTHRTVPTREGRAVEGFSMGGFGALHLALKHPDRFVAATSVSGALLDATGASGRPAAFFASVFGGEERFREECPGGLARRNADRIRGRLRIRLAVGDRDALRKTMWIMHGTLQELSIGHELTLLADVGHLTGAVYLKLGDRTAAFYRSVFGE